MSEEYNPKTTLMGSPLGKKGLSKERKYNVDAYNKSHSSPRSKALKAKHK